MCRIRLRKARTQSPGSRREAQRMRRGTLTGSRTHSSNKAAATSDASDLLHTSDAGTTLSCRYTAVNQRHHLKAANPVMELGGPAGAVLRLLILGYALTRGAPVMKKILV